MSVVVKKIKDFLQIEPVNSITQDEIYQFFDYEKLSKYILPISYDQDGGFFILEDNTLGIGFLVNIKPSVGKETLNFLENGIYQDPQLPDNTMIQWILWGGDFVEPLLEAYLSRKDQSNALAYDIAKEFVRFANEKVENEIYDDWKIPLRNTIGMLFIKIPFDLKSIGNDADYEARTTAVKHIRASIYGTLTQAGFGPQKVDAETYLIFARLLLNPSHETQESIGVQNYDPDIALKEQVIFRDTEIEQHVDGNYLRIDKQYAKLLTAKMFPKDFTIAEANEWYGSIRHMNRNQINCKFIVSFVFRKASEKEINSIRVKTETIMKQKSFSFLSTKLNERQEDCILFARETESGQAVWRGLMTICLYDADKVRVRDSLRVLKNLDKIHNLDLQEEVVPLPFYLACIPFNIVKELTAQSVARAYTMFSYNAAHLTPVQFDWVGSGTPIVPLVSRRGQLAFVDLWDTNGGMNACIVAPMGQGKSMFANHLIFNYRSLPNTKIRVIDVGESYFGIAKLFNGQFIKPEFNNPIRINPFSHIKNIDSDSDFLINIVDTMIKPNERCSDTERGMISVAIRNAYEKYGNDMDINAVKSEIDIIADKNDDYEFRKLSDYNLSPWCKGGQYEDFMTGRSEIDLSNDLVVFELGDIKDDIRLTNVFLLSMFFFINNEIYRGDRDTKKIVVWDEAWRFADNKGVLGFIEGGAREYRKFNGSLIFITQGISDLLKNDVTKTLKNNSEYLFIFWQPPEEWERMFKDKDVYLSEYEKDIYRDTIKTIKGKYSEMLVISRSMGRGILRLVLPPELYWVYTTNAQEVALRNKYFKETGGDILKTIQLCIENTKKEV